MKKLLFSLFAMSALCLGFVSCTEEIEEPGSIYGVVTDKATGEPIRSAGVELSPTGAKTVTGSEGQFEFTALAAGQYTLVITKSGYTDYTSSTITVKTGAVTKTDVQIEQLPPALRIVNDHREDISTLDFGDAEADVARSFNIFNDGVKTLEWEITKTAEWITSISKQSGSLEAGSTQALIVTIDRTKLVSGKNTTTVHITSNNGSKQLTVVATNSKASTTLNTLPVSNIKTTSATLNGEIISEGNPKYTERGFVYSSNGTPTVENTIRKVTASITNEKVFSATIGNLQMGTTYYVRAYAINAGKVSYSSNEVPFTPSQALPQVTTDAVTNLSLNGTATLNGTIVDTGDPAYTERGFVYGTQHNPTTEGDTKQSVGGSGLGAYSANISGLEVGQIYYIRAYATNTMGTAYGEEQVIELVDTEYASCVEFTYAGYNYKAYYMGQEDYENATMMCEDLHLGGYSDWYLPNIEEMSSVIANSTIGTDATFIDIPWWTSDIEYNGESYDGYHIHLLMQSDGLYLGFSEDATHNYFVAVRKYR